jgi:hypothetical protein
MHGCTVPPLPHWTILLLLEQKFQRPHYVKHVPPNLFAKRVQMVRLNVEAKGVLRSGLFQKRFLSFVLEDVSE